jgi:serine/threonine-protein kinase
MDSAKSPVEIGPGVVLGGCRLERPVGAGGMGQVWLARQLSLDRTVAVKILAPDLARDPEYVQRFRREAMHAAKISSSYVVQTYDAVEERGLAFIVMEFLEGRTLEERLKHKGPLAEAQALHVLQQGAKGLAAAHDLGLVHRDVKPANIFLQKKGPIKLLDFGLVHAEGEMTHLTSPGTVMGTPDYMSPEQCEGKPATAVSDLYSLGATAYAALAGRAPFRGANPVAVLRMHLDTEPRPLRELRPELGEPTELLIRRLMAKDPADRPKRAKDVAQEAERLIRCLAGSPAKGTLPTPKVEARAFRLPGVLKRLGRREWIAGGALLLAFLAGGLFFALKGKDAGIRASEIDPLVTRFYTLRARIIPEGAAPSRTGLLEIGITPKPGLVLSAAHGESHGHKHKVAEYGMDLSPTSPIKFETTELLPPEIRTATTLRARFTVPRDVRPGKYPVRISHRYQAGEIGGSPFEADRMEMSVEVIVE